jgi:hypothetical protein
VTVPEALDQVREAGSVRVEDGKLKVQFPEPERTHLEPALAALRANREAAIGLLTREAEAAPLAPDDPEAWRAFPYGGEKGLPAFIRRMERQREWWGERQPSGWMKNPARTES